jgi:Fe-S-cluster containining protein
MYLDVHHADVLRVDDRIFKITFAPDCMVHACRCREESDRHRNDACCQYGADVFLPEREAILRRRAEVASVLKQSRRDPAGWFDERNPELDPAAPSGIILRTATADPEDDTSGCVFLQHEGERGCGLHRAALQHGFSPSEIKPRVCRLYPVSFGKGRLGLSPDFNDYSCAGDSGPTVYRLMRDAIGEIFGMELIAELDRLEARGTKSRLRVLAPRQALRVEGRPDGRSTSAD